MSEFIGIIERGLQRLNNSHVQDLHLVLQEALSVIHPNQRQSGGNCLEKFSSDSINLINVFLQRVQDFVLSTIKNTNTNLTSSKIDELLGLVQSSMPSDLYDKRFDVFESAFARHVSRYGSSMKLSDYRPDISKALLSAFTTNRRRDFISELNDALLIEIERQLNSNEIAGKKGNTQMSYLANVFNVMIASPGDVAEERGIVRDVLYQWNAVNYKGKKIVLLPLGWETHSSPEMGGHPQTIINRQVLTKGDLLVGIFGTRIGTETEHHLSGSVEEIEEYISANKPTMLYFSKQPIKPDLIDADQIKKLKDFKGSCEKRGLYEQYDDLMEFKYKFYHQLQLKVNEHPLFKINDENGDEQINLISNTNSLNLSSEAMALLKEVSQSSDGLIEFLQVLSGTYIETNGKDMITSDIPREVAKWENALKELKKYDLIDSDNGIIFKITDLGFQVADTL